MQTFSIANKKKYFSPIKKKLFCICLPVFRDSQLAFACQSLPPDEARPAVVGRAEHHQEHDSRKQVLPAA